MSVWDNGVYAALDKALNDERPGKRARDMALPRRSPGRGRSRLALIASGLFFCLLVAGLTVPAVARAIGDVPWLGDGYLKFLTETGMDVAYQAGLVDELNSSDTHDGITFTVLSAYADAAQTVIMFQFSGDPAKLEELWTQPNFIYPEFTKKFSLSRGLSGGGEMQLVPEEGLIYGIWSGDWLPRRVLGHKFYAEIKSLELSLSFPVQTIPSRLNRRVQIDQRFDHEGAQFIFEEAIFSPGTTQITYCIHGDLEARHFEWALVADDGTEYTPISGGLSNGQEGVMNFLPIDSDELTLLYKGYIIVYYHEDVLPLAAGSGSLTPGGELIIDNVVNTEAGTQVTLAWSGEGKLGKVGFTLLDAQGNSCEVAQAEMIEDGLILTIEHGELNGPVEIELDTVIVKIEEEAEVTRIQNK